jgi:hypothetical protein
MTAEVPAIRSTFQEGNKKEGKANRTQGFLVLKSCSEAPPTGFCFHLAEKQSHWEKKEVSQQAPCCLD